MSELIEPHVSKVVYDVNEFDIAWFRKDKNMIFKRYSDKSFAKGSLFKKRNIVPITDRIKKSFYSWMLNNPPYGHPVLKKKLKKNWDDYN